MEEYFLNRFKGKTEVELQSIVDNRRDYQISAVNAALKLLDKETFQQVTQIEKTEKVDNHKTSSIEGHRLWLQKIPFRTISKISLTHLTLALLFLTLQETLSFLGYNIIYIYHLLATAVLLLISHKIYHLEEGTLYSFKGRVYNDFYFMLVFLLCKNIYNFMMEIELMIIDLWELLFLLLFIFIFMVAFEGMVSVLYITFKKYKCPEFLK